MAAVLPPTASGRFGVTALQVKEAAQVAGEVGRAGVLTVGFQAGGERLAQRPLVRRGLARLAREIALVELHGEPHGVRGKDPRCVRRDSNPHTTRF
jgi:hypothetical protein